MLLIMEQTHILINRIRHEITSKPEFLKARLQAEDQARKLLDDKSGAFDVNDMEKFLNLCNIELVPANLHSNKLRQKLTRTRFRLSFIGQNRNLMIGSLELCNYWIHCLWHSVDDPIMVLSQFWSKNQVPGAGMGLPTMILYLKNPVEYNVWLPFLNDACNLLTESKLSSKRTVQNYLLYNKTINEELRNPLSLKPQEIDYILFRIRAESRTI